MITTTRKEALCALKQLTVKTTSYSSAMNYATALMESREYPEAKVGFIAGGAGYGKTTICEMLKQKHPDEVSDELTTKSIAYVSLTGEASKGDFLNSIHKELTGRYFPGKSKKNGEKENILAEMLKALKVKLVIVDEGQHAISGGKDENSRTGSFINLLKTLLDNSNVPILVVGLDKIKELRSLDDGRNEEFSKQLKRRSFKPFYLQPLTLNDTRKTIGNFYNCLTALNVNCELLKSTKFVKRLYLCSGGAIGIISNFIAWSIIEEDDGLHITDGSVMTTAERMFDESEDMFGKTDEIVEKILSSARKGAK